MKNSFIFQMIPCHVTAVLPISKRSNKTSRPAKYAFSKLLGEHKTSQQPTH